MTISPRGLWLRARYYLMRARVDREMNEEMAFHLEQRAAEHRHAGLADEAAQTAALRRFGNRTVMQENRRAALGLPSLDTLAQDARAAGRSLRAAPGFSAMVVLTLGLAIGANAAMFAIVDRLLLRGPAYVTAPDRVVRLYFTESGEDGATSSTGSVTGFVTYAHLREHSRAFTSLAVYARTEATVGRGIDAHRVQLGRVSASFFPLLGVRPRLGRFFAADEDQPPRGTNVVVLDEGYWDQAFGRDSTILGRTMRIGGETYTIIGVAPKGFTGVQLERRDAWVPISLPYWGPGDGWTTAWDVQWLQVIGRLAPGVTPAQAGRDATQAHRRAYDGPTNHTMRSATVSVAPLRYNSRGQETTEARVARWLIAVSTIVLLIACANVANLFLARAARRRREVAVRLALGIGRARLIRVLLLESTLLGVMGALVGVVVALAGSRFVRSVLLPNVAWTDAGIDLRVLIVTAASGLVTGLLVGLVPALQGTRLDLTAALRSGIREGGGQRSRLRTSLTVAQAALSVVLLVGAALFVRSLWNVYGLQLGIEPAQIVTVAFDWPSLGGVPQDEAARERARRTAFYERALERVRAMAGVSRAAVVVGTPFQSSFEVALHVPGRDSIPRVGGRGPSVQAVSDDYFATAGTRVLRGRSFTASEVASHQLLALVNETMARTLWPGADAIGQCLRIDTLPCSRVIGIVEDAHQASLREEPSMQYYVPLGQELQLGFGGRRLFIRPTARGVLRPEAIRAEILRLDPGLGFVTVRRLQDALDPQIRPWRLGATMFALFGALALVVAAIGLYSVISYVVAQRRHELGVRIALGAQVGNIAGLVVRYGVGLAAAGVLIGSVIALNAARWIEPLMFDTSPRNPWVFALVAGVLLVVALVASVVPAWRATRVDPMQALRTE